MAISVEYVVKETAGNLWRNRLMSLAAVLTVAVSLSLVGAALLIKQGVSTATSQWQGGVQLLIFFNPNAPASEKHSVEVQLKQMAEVKSFFYVDRAASYKEFKRLMANEPDLLNAVTQNQIPPSYRVVLKDPAEAPALGKIFAGQPGVKTTEYNFGAIKTMLDLSSIAQAVIIALALVLLLSATVLIFNVIRVGIFARRREVSVMKLVGATNWFIRIPFMLEGLTQGLVGAVVAAAGVLGLQSLFNYAINHFGVKLLSGFVITSSDVIFTEIFVLAVGIVVGAGGSMIAVRRYLEV